MTQSLSFKSGLYFHSTDDFSLHGKFYLTPQNHSVWMVDVDRKDKTFGRRYLVSANQFCEISGLQLSLTEGDLSFTPNADQSKVPLEVLQAVQKAISAWGSRLAEVE